MKKPEIKDAGAEYAEIWGEAIHTNRHLRMISGGLAIAVLLLIVVVFRIVSVEPPRPIVVRVDEVGRAEAVSYEAMEAQADPLDPTTKYFLNRFIYDFYSPWREIGPYLRELWHRPAGPMNWKNPIRVFAVVGWLVVQGFVLLGWAGFRVFQGFLLLAWAGFRVGQFVAGLPPLLLFFFAAVG